MFINCIPNLKGSRRVQQNASNYSTNNKIHLGIKFFVYDVFVKKMMLFQIKYIPTTFKKVQLKLALSKPIQNSKRLSIDNGP